MTSSIETENSKPRKRPLSPHLQIYRLPLTAITSILHRATGVALSVGAVVLALWLWAAAANPAYFSTMKSMFRSPIGLIALYGWTLALYYHLCAGIRHLLWDVGVGFEKASYTFSNQLVILGALALTLATWFWAYPRII